MYAVTTPSCIIKRQNLVRIFSSIGGNFKKLLPDIYLHSGRTDGSGGHNDKKNKSGLGSYHYHHGVSAHLHPNGVCPYGSKKTFIINPYTGKKISLGQPYLFPYYDGNSPNVEYYSLNLVSKALTANDNIGVKLGLDNTGGLFYACSTGDSTMNNLGEEFLFTYPKNLIGLKENKFFETNEGKLQLLAALDGSSTAAYISLETVRGYMTKDGYFTDLSDHGSSVWNFKVRKPTVNILPINPPQNRDFFYVGDEVTVEAYIKNVASARLIVGNYFSGYTDGFEERRYNLENEPKVTFSRFKLTEDIIGNASIKNGSLSIMIEGHTGGTAIEAETDARALGDAVTIRVRNSEGSGNQSGQLKEIFFPDVVTGTLNGTPITLYPTLNWGGAGAGNYSEWKGPKENGRYIVAVGPKFFNPNYPDNGRIWTGYDGLEYPLFLDVVLEHKTTGETKTIECVARDVKAHSYNTYPDGHAHNTGDIVSIDVENGIIQTGISYPCSWNAGQSKSFAPNDIQSIHIIEFCWTTVDFKCNDYKLVKVIVKDEV